MNSQLRLLRDVLANFPIFICIIHKESDEVLFCNKYAAELLGGNAEGRKGREVLSELPDYTAELTELRHLDVVLEDKYFKVTVIESDFAGGTYIMTGMNVSENVVFTEQLLARATLDQLTSVYNRHTGLETLRMYIDNLRGGGGAFAVCFLDLNGLKYINDNFGHKAGDNFLMAVVNIIKKAVRRTDVLARIGGDEFMILFPNCKEQFAERIMSTIAERLEEVSRSLMNGRQYSVSYGIQEVNADNCMEAEDALDAADKKMYRMKEEYRRKKAAGVR